MQTLTIIALTIIALIFACSADLLAQSHEKKAKIAKLDNDKHALLHFSNEKNEKITKLEDNKAKLEYNKAKLEDALFESRFAYGQDIVHEKRLGASLGSSVAFDADTMPATWNWTLCKSEGGPLNCAMCNVTGVVGQGAGALRCDLLVPLERENGVTCAEDKNHKHCPARCPDGLLGSFWMANGQIGKGQCKQFSDRDVQMARPDVLTYSRTDLPDFLPGATGSTTGGDMNGSYIFTKMTTAHVNKMSLDVGVIVAKRGILHRHTKTGYLVADVYKVGHCLKCHEEVFSSIWTRLVTEEDHENFYNKCVKVAFNNTHLKEEYQCNRTSKDYKLYEAMIGGY